MAEEFLTGFSRAAWGNTAEDGLDVETRSEAASSGSCFAAGGDLRSLRWPGEVTVSKEIWPWEESADSETIHGSDPAETSGYLIDSLASANNHLLSCPVDWSQLLMSGSCPEENLHAMQQDHLSSRTNSFHASSVGSNGFQTGTGTSGILSKQFEQQGFLLDGLVNENFPSQMSTRVAAAGLSSHLSIINDVKAKSSAMQKMGSGSPALKKPRVETPSPLPTFKVRKEKLGDRITALQQLVSPFGKTDTASVLYEAIEYIKLLHDQVGILSTPYLKNGSSMQHKRVESEKSTENVRPRHDLQSRGLCLVPISSAFSITNDNTMDYWTPAFGASYKLER